MRAEADYRLHHSDELQRLRQENAALRLELQHKNEALLQLRTMGGMAGNFMEAYNRVFAELDPPPLIDIAVVN